MQVKINKVIKDMLSGDYHATPDLTRSQIVDLLKDPCIWKYNKEHHEETKPLIFGAQFHELVLEGIEPSLIKSKITQKDIDQLYGMAETAKHLLPEGGDREISYFFTVNGIPCKCRPDLIIGDTIYDLKSTSEPIEKFRWTIKKYRYDIQAAWYKLGTGAEHFKFVAIEKRPPYLGRVIEIGDESQAIKDIQEALAIYQEIQLMGEDSIVPWDDEVIYI